MKVGLIGLGAMGLPMGRRLLGAGHDLYVVPHVRREPAVDLAAAGAQIVDRASELTGECAVVLTSVPDVPQVQEVLFGEYGLDKGSGKGLLFIDLSTINPTAAREAQLVLIT
ncbi:MAG: NAD(P)-binding domain-containing protein, partial [Chloroflexota bacterium]